MEDISNTINLEYLLRNNPFWAIMCIQFCVLLDSRVYFHLSQKDYNCKESIEDIKKLLNQQMQISSTSLESCPQGL